MISDLAGDYMHLYCDSTETYNWDHQSSWFNFYSQWEVRSHLYGAGSVSTSNMMSDDAAPQYLKHS